MTIPTGQGQPQAPLRAHLALPMLTRELSAELKLTPGMAISGAVGAAGAIDALYGPTHVTRDLNPAERRIMLDHAARLVLFALLIGMSVGCQPQQVLDAAANVAARAKKHAARGVRTVEREGASSATKQGS